MEHVIRDHPRAVRGPLERGFWIGALIAAGAVASWLILFLVIDVPDGTSLFDPILAGPGIVILVVGYLTGLAAAIKRPTRRLGLGILIGVTVASPVLFMLTFGVLYAIYGGA